MRFRFHCEVESRTLRLLSLLLVARDFEIYPVLSWLAPREWPETGWFQFASSSRRVGLL